MSKPKTLVDKREPAPSSGSGEPAEPAFRWCFNTGRWGLFVWLGGGMVLEALHLVKAPHYLEDALRRELWTLAHAHGTLLSAVVLLLVVLAPRLALSETRRRLVDRLAAVGSILVPLGFLLGGVGHSEADPSLAILLVPVGACLLAAALLWVALAGRR